MNNLAFSAVAWIFYIKTLFVGLVIIVVTVIELTKEFSLNSFLLSWMSVFLAFTVIWLGWWFKRAVTGRKGLFTGWNWSTALTFVSSKHPLITERATKFWWQALFICANILTPLGITILIA